VAGTIILAVAAILFGGMEGGFSAWQLFSGTCVAGIPAFALLAFVAWLSGGKRSEAGVGPANVKVPVRFLKALPYLSGIIALFYLMKAMEAFQSR
jgi:hypothetical protein